MSEQMENNNIEVELTEENRPVTRRYNKRGKRRGKYAYAAPVGFLVSLLSIVGVIAIVMGVVGFIQKQTDDTALKEEIYYYLEPLLLYSPEPFDNAAKTEQDAFLNAAAYRVMLAENIRMLREGAEYPKYPVDENYRIAVPVEEINASYAALFGKKAKGATIVYSVLAVVFIILGSCLQNDLVWELTDMFNNLMVIPNVLALAVLSGIVVAAVKAKKKNK